MQCGPPGGRGHRGEATAAQASLSPGRTRSLTPRRRAPCGLGVGVGAGCRSGRHWLTPSAPSAPFPRCLGPGAPPRLMGRVGLAGRVSGAPRGAGRAAWWGVRAGAHPRGGSGREAVALGRAAMGREVSGRPPAPPAPSDARRAPDPGDPTCFPSHPAATFLYLPRVIGASNSSSLLLSLPFSRLPVSVSFGPENVFLSPLGRVLKKLLGS